MADRIEREIEEILAKLDDLPEDGRAAPDRSPIPLAAVRKQRAKAVRAARPSPLAAVAQRLSGTTILLTGATLVVFGLVLSNVWGPLIWAALAGVLMFFGAFLSGFLRRPKSTAAAQPPPPSAVFWRDRYITYTDPKSNGWNKLRRRFGRRG